MRNLGEVVDDCPSCGLVDGVTYRGEKDGKYEASCTGCNEIFEIEDDSDTEQTTPDVAPEPAPAPPKKEEPTQKSSDGLGQLTPVQDSHDPKSTLKLSSDDVDDFTDGGGDVPSYIRNSRAWRWAHKMGNTGNPYRIGSKNSAIFEIYAEQPRTIEECVLESANRQYNDKLSYLLTIYEVTAHCLSTGLLVMDAESRKIAPCQGKPVPIRLT